MVIYVDVDNTICRVPHELNYSDAIPIKANIEKINKLYDQGHTIIYWTARGSKSGTNYRDLTEKQLVRWRAKHSILLTGKPVYDMFIDDKNIRIDEL